MRNIIKYAIVGALIIYLGVSWFVRSPQADGWGRAYLFEVPFIGGFNWWLVFDLLLIFVTILLVKSINEKARPKSSFPPER